MSILIVSLLRWAYKLWDELEDNHLERLLYAMDPLDAGLADSEVFEGSLYSC